MLFRSGCGVSSIPSLPFILISLFSLLPSISLYISKVKTIVSVRVLLTFRFFLYNVSIVAERNMLQHFFFQKLYLFIYYHLSLVVDIGSCLITTSI